MTKSRNSRNSRSITLLALLLFALLGRAATAADRPQPTDKTVYKTAGDVQLALHLFYPPDHRPDDQRPAIVFFFGGGWVGGSPSQFYPHCAHLASRGMVAAAAEYRVKNQHGTSPYACVEDGKSAVRYLRGHARQLGIDPDRLAAGGGSAGGHVAAATATVEGFHAASDDTHISCVPNALVLFNPVYDNGPDGYGHDRVREKWEQFSPLHNIRPGMPPAIVFLGTQDRLIPVSTAEAFRDKMRAVGSRSELALFQGQAHGFFNFGRSQNRYYQRTVAAMDQFLQSLGFLAAAQASDAPSTADPPTGGTYDIVVYGGTSAGVIAAVQAKKMGKSAVIVCPDNHLGGLTSGGLGWTDTGNKAVIGGLAREFYHRVWKHYQSADAWRWQPREEYGNRGQGTPAIDGQQRTMWIFEPHVAEQVYEDFVAEYNIPVHRDRWLDRQQGVQKSGARIEAITMLSGETYRGQVLLDATYEGDLMAAAGVDYHVGREPQSQYDEKWNGVQTGVLHHRHHFGVLKTPIDPYVTPGDPSSGLLPRISPDPPGEFGSGDKKVQAYCFRMCLTDLPENRVPFPQPAGYDPDQYQLLLRIFDAGWRETFHKFDPIPNHKTDTNNHGPFSTDNIGYNYDYPEASYQRRAEIIRQHETYQKGLMYFIANDRRVPEDVRTKMSQWGLAKDEFVDNGNWPHQIYVREARRMIGQYVMTENELLKRRPTPESIGMGSYGIDSHNVQRYVTPEGHVQNEGDIGVSTKGPYQIALGSIQPKPQQCENLLVPVCVSSSHIAFGSIRMEPVFMILGQSAATTAAMAIDEGLAVQQVDYDQLRKRLLADGQVLEAR
jgi:acetyl esterase/lipase